MGAPPDDTADISIVIAMLTDGLKLCETVQVVTVFDVLEKVTVRSEPLYGPVSTVLKVTKFEVLLPN